MEEELQDKIGYHFQSPEILREALQPAGTAPLQGNKRLALVGDSALVLSILDKSYQHNETIRKHCNLDRYLQKPPAQRGVITQYTRASALEAILGAVWFDSNMDIHAVDRVRKKLGLDP
ncbi:hypothetical protein N7471_012988 [Penicillium samsonianum]|uniref:uncharacterized protein n=1 Tax=Penicillium samsonianum TaxID=1882272 RepID=UPI002548C6A4|nr:uncharacterized protein N7471_012988 [Penicillium samsonianum]KAJ6119037.1 hypothetical protein N7471_012988 [Penicillium samsonianum]